MCGVKVYIVLHEHAFIGERRACSTNQKADQGQSAQPVGFMWRAAKPGIIKPLARMAGYGVVLCTISRMLGRYALCYICIHWSSH